MYWSNDVTGEKMELKNFVIEQWLNPMDSQAKHNLGSSCVKVRIITKNNGKIERNLQDMSGLRQKFLRLSRK